MAGRISLILLLKKRNIFGTRLDARERIERAREISFSAHPLLREKTSLTSRKPKTDLPRQANQSARHSAGGRLTAQLLQRGFDDKHVRIEGLDRTARIERACAQFQKLLPEPVPVIAELFEGFAIFQTDIAVDDHLHCF
jgi:hypothetical protein